MMTVPQAAAHAAELLGDVRALAGQIGEPAGGAVAPVPASLARVDSVTALRSFLSDYHRDVFSAREWPVIIRVHELARTGQARELAALDREWAVTAKRQGFAEASFRVGRRQLAKLRPLRDQRVVTKYLAAIEAGEAHGWHPLAYGIVLAVFNLPLRQGLVSYAAQTLGGFVDAAIRGHRLPERECVSVLDEICAALPASLPPLPDALLFAAV
jgi:urease accessory protein UreF